MRQREMDGSRHGLIVPLNAIWRPIDLVPVFGEKFVRAWRSVDAVEIAGEFFVNSFFDKNTFRHVYYRPSCG